MKTDVFSCAPSRRQVMERIGHSCEVWNYGPFPFAGMAGSWFMWGVLMPGEE